VSSFETPLFLEYLDGVDWRVTDRFDYACDILGRVIVIPKDFTTNFCSTPRFLWPIYPPTGRYGKASVVHDYLYRTPGQASRSQADRVYVEAMTVLKVGRVTRWIMYAGLRAAGGGAYKGGLEHDVAIDASGHVLQ